MTFQEKLDTIIQKNNSLVCVGLDSDVDKLPESIKHLENPQFEFNKKIIDATHDLICTYKPNSAFYEALGDRGLRELKMTCDYINQIYPKIPIILDAKRGDIGNTNAGYIKFAYEYLHADAITLNPYLGHQSLIPYLNITDKGAIILCLTSNPGAEELQKKILSNQQGEWLSSPEMHSTMTGEPLYISIAKIVTNEWNTNNNCMLVVGATHPEELTEIRKVAGEMTFLVPGIGAQGGDIEKTVRAGLNSQKAGMIINSSRGIIFASNGEDFAEKAREETMKLRDAINTYRI